jgi:hypothetical protein
VSQKLRVTTTRLFERVGQHREAVREERTVRQDAVLVRRLGQTPHNAIVPGEPGGVDGHGPEREGAEEVAEQGTLVPSFLPRHPRRL